MKNSVCVKKFKGFLLWKSKKVLHVTSRDFHIFIIWGIVAKFKRNWINFSLEKKSLCDIFWEFSFLVFRPSWVTFCIFLILSIFLNFFFPYIFRLIFQKKVWSWGLKWFQRRLTRYFEGNISYVKIRRWQIVREFEKILGESFEKFTGKSWILEKMGCCCLK